MAAEYISSLKAAWEVAKAIKVATDSINDAHLKLQIAELISALADAKIEAAENAEKISELRNLLKAKSELKYMEGKYFKVDESGEKDGPFCSTCYDSTSKEIRLLNIQGSYGGDWQCRVCSGLFR